MKAQSSTFQGCVIPENYRTRLGAEWKVDTITYLNPLPVIFSWIQLRTPKDMLGRVMSMLMLASLGLVPLSQAISGAISKWNLTSLFALAGSLVLLMTFWAAFQPALRSLSEEMITGQG